MSLGDDALAFAALDRLFSQASLWSVCAHITLTLLDTLIRLDPDPPPEGEEGEEDEESASDSSSWTLALYATAAPPMTMRMRTTDAPAAANMTRLRCCSCFSTRRRSVSGPKSENAADMVDGVSPLPLSPLSLPLPLPGERQRGRRKSNRVKGRGLVFLVVLEKQWR